MDAFCPQQHILRHGFTFGQHTLNGSDVLTEDQEEDVFAHRSGMVDPCFEDDPPTGVFTRKIGDPLRLPFCERGQRQFARSFRPPIQERIAPDFWFVNGLSP